MALLLPACAALPPAANAPKDTSTGLADARSTKLGRLFQAQVRLHGGESGFRLISEGVEGLRVRLRYRVSLRSDVFARPSRLAWLTEEGGTPVQCTTESARGEWERLEIAFLSLFPLDGEL